MSESTVSRITDKVLPAAKEWQQKPLESIYAVMFMNAIHYHVRSEGQIMKKAVYIAIGIDLDGRKDVLEICGWVRTKAPNTGQRCSTACGTGA